MFSSDYPHVEGGRNPVKRFDASLAGCDEATTSAFYSGNFADLLGRAILTPATAIAPTPPVPGRRGRMRMGIELRGLP